MVLDDLAGGAGAEGVAVRTRQIGRGVGLGDRLQRHRQRNAIEAVDQRRGIGAFRIAGDRQRRRRAGHAVHRQNRADPIDHRHGGRRLTGGRLLHDAADHLPDIIRAQRLGAGQAGQPDQRGEQGQPPGPAAPHSVTSRVDAGTAIAARVGAGTVRIGQTGECRLWQLMQGELTFWLEVAGSA